jgi:fumarate reductase subunit D
MEDIKLSRQEIKDGAPFAVLSYVLFLWILTFIFKKENRFAYFHARQGVVIFVGNIICFAFMFIPVLGVLFSLAQIILIFLSLYGIYLCLTGQTKNIAVVGDIAEKLVI